MAMTSNLFDLADIPYVLYPLIPMRWMYPFVGLEASLMHRFDRKTRSIIRNNLASTFGHTKSEEEIEELTRQFFEYKQLRTLLLYLFPKLNSAEKEKLFPIDGLQNLDRALAQDKGAIICGAHISSALALVVKDLLRERGYDVSLPSPVKELPYPPSAFRKFVDRLSSNGHREYQAGIFHAQFNIRPMVRLLKGKRVLLMMGDGAHSAGFAEVDFLGRRVLLTTGIVGISRLTGAPTVPFFITGAPPEGLRIVIEEPIPIEKTEDAQRDLQAMVENYAKRLEYHLLQNIPSWQHWLVENNLESMSNEFRKPLHERYHVH